MRSFTPNQIYGFVKSNFNHEGHEELEVDDSEIIEY